MASSSSSDPVNEGKQDTSPGSKKSFKSSIVIIPPEELWDPIQAIRKNHDKAYVRWMPHVNLLYPFIQDEGEVFVNTAQELKNALKDIAPFKVRFSENSFKAFIRKKSCTLWLKPSESEESSDIEDIGQSHTSILKLQEAMVATFPQCNDVNKISDHGFTPHLSVGQFRAKDLKAAVPGFRTNWKDMEFTVNEVALISRADFDDPFHVRHRVAIGTAL